EKPQLKRELDTLVLSPNQLQRLDINPSQNLDYLGSMGIYIFKRNVLIDLLQKDLREDFGKHLIPFQVAKGNVATYIHRGYWEDIGTIESFYKANIALTDSSPLFNCYNEDWRIFANQS